MASLLKNIKKAKVKNIVWLTADVHYTAAHYYDPAKASSKNFSPFWEFVAGPPERRFLRTQHHRCHVWPAGGIFQGSARRSG